MNSPEIDIEENKYWYNDKGLFHREDGPAIECDNGTKYWYINGKLHREDGPAIEWYSGDIEGSYEEWWYNDEFVGSSWIRYTQEDFERYLRSLKIKEYW